MSLHDRDVQVPENVQFNLPSNFKQLHYIFKQERPTFYTRTDCFKKLNTVKPDTSLIK